MEKERERETFPMGSCLALPLLAFTEEHEAEPMLFSAAAWALALCSLVSIQRQWVKEASSELSSCLMTDLWCSSSYR